MNDDQPLGVLTAADLLNTVRIDEGDARYKDGGNLQLQQVA